MTGKNGFSLLETLIALTILALGIIAAMRLFPASLRQSQVAAERTIVAELADSWLGRVHALGGRYLLEKHDLTLRRTLGEHYDLTIPFTIRQTDRAFTVYTGAQTAIQRMAGASQVYFQRVTFTVQLPDGRLETFVTYVAQR